MYNLPVSFRNGGDRWGLHRVVSPKGALPQAAETLDPSLPIFDNELLIRVERLNVDAASFANLVKEAKGDPKKIAARIDAIVRERGKMHNPATNSGGVLLGTIDQIGPKHPDSGLKTGDRVATLISLTLTPLVLSRVGAVDITSHQVNVEGHAILFASGVASLVPTDIPEAVALAVLDVCGAPATLPRVAKRGEIVAVIGAGKAGVLSMAAAKEVVGDEGMVLAIDSQSAAIVALEDLDFIDDGIVADATDPLAVSEKVRVITRDRMADVVVNCASAPQTEMASILACRPGGTAVFFNMTTNFQAAVLGAEGLACDVRLLMGSGYVPGHAAFALDLIRRSQELLQWFAGRSSS